MPESLTTIAYLVAGVLFILSLGGLSTQKTARRGNPFGIVGMLHRAAASRRSAHVHQLRRARRLRSRSAACIGAVFAARVEMTSMPELVAVLHSFVGLAARAGRLRQLLGRSTPDMARAEGVIHAVEMFVGVFVGAITFTGSVVAFGKLQGDRARQAACCCRGATGSTCAGLLVSSGARRARSSGASEHEALSSLLIHDGRGRRCSASTWSWRSAAPTCRWSSRCSTATRAGPRRRPASCSKTIC